MSLLVAPDPAWRETARQEIERWHKNVPGVVAVHHIGSTSVPGLPAKPIIDLLPVFDRDETRENARSSVMELGYEWMGAYGLDSRSYARLIEPETGKRRVHAHGYTRGHPDIARHLAFRDILRENAALRAAYTSIKAACASKHRFGGPEYGDCKSRWIDKVEKRALERKT